MLPTNAVGTDTYWHYYSRMSVKKKRKEKRRPILMNTLKEKYKRTTIIMSMMLKGVLDKLEQLDDIVDEVSGVKKEIIGQVEETQYTTFKDKYMGQMLNEESSTAKICKEMEYILVKVGGTMSLKSKFTNLTLCKKWF